MLVNCPTKESLWTANSVEEFKSLTANTKTNEMIVRFRYVMALPPFITRVFINANSLVPEELAFLAVAASKLFLKENKDLLNLATLRSSLGDLLSFIWAISQGKIVHMVYTIVSSVLVKTWCNLIYKNCLHLYSLNYVTRTGPIGPSDDTMATIAEEMVKLNKIIEDNIVQKKKEKDDKK